MRRSIKAKPFRSIRDINTDSAKLDNLTNLVGQLDGVSLDMRKLPHEVEILVPDDSNTELVIDALKSNDFYEISVVDLEDEYDKTGRKKRRERKKGMAKDNEGIEYDDNVRQHALALMGESDDPMGAVSSGSRGVSDYQTVMTPDGEGVVIGKVGRNPIVRLGPKREQEFSLSDISIRHNGSWVPYYKYEDVMQGDSEEL